MKPDIKCTTTQMMKVIIREIELPNGDLTQEHRLILAVIEQAISDLLVEWEMRSARSFFRGELFVTYCELVGLHPEAVRRKLVEGGFLSA